jgi:hypothetical protein
MTPVFDSRARGQMALDHRVAGSRRIPVLGLIQNVNIYVCNISRWGLGLYIEIEKVSIASAAGEAGKTRSGPIISRRV